MATEVVVQGTQWVDVALAAVQIGFGALIGGVTTYLVTKENHKHELSKVKIEKKIEILQETIQKIDTFYSSMDNFLNYLYGTSYKYSGFYYNDLPDNEKKNFLKTRKKFSQSLRTISLINSKLHLLGCKEFENISEEHINTVVNFNNDFGTNEIELKTPQYFQNLHGESYDIQKEINKTLQELFNTLK